MKKFNKELIEKRKKVSQITLHKSMATVEKLTHPSKKLSCIGSVIGGSIGVGLIVFGIYGVVSGYSFLGAGSLLAGVITIFSNTVNFNKNKK